jgi:cytochrome P450
MLIINSYDEAIALLHSKGDRYSERPEMYFLNEIVGWGKCITLLPEGHALKKHRRLFANQLGSRVGLKRYEHLVYARTRNFVHSLMQEPSQDMLLPHLR